MAKCLWALNETVKEETPKIFLPELAARSLWGGPGRLCGDTFTPLEKLYRCRPVALMATGIPRNQGILGILLCMFLP